MNLTHKYFIKTYLSKLPIIKFHMYKIFFYLRDFTYILEKIKTQKFTKLLLNKFTCITIQEHIFSKYIMFINKQYFYSKFNHKYSPVINLHNYLLNNFPVFNYNINISNKINLYELKSQIYYLKNKTHISTNLNLQKTFLLNSLKSIESIFELYLSKSNTTIVSPTINLLLNFNLYKKSLYCLEIPCQNLLNNLHITLIYTISKTYLNYLKLSNTLIIGGDVLSVENFCPYLITSCYYNTLISNTSVYFSSKNTTVYVYNLILESLLKQYKTQGILLPSFLFELIVKRMVSYVKILKSGDTLLMYQDIVPGTLVNLINKSFMLNGLIGALYMPILMGISKLSLSCSGILSSLSFQNTLKFLSTSVLDNHIDWILDLKAKIIMSDLLDVGTGWYKHYNIKP